MHKILNNGYERCDQDLWSNITREKIREYRNFRSFTRAADYPHRPIIAYGEKKVTRLPALVYNPHVVIQLFGGENVTLR